MKKPHTRSGRKYPRRKLWFERRNAAFSRAGLACEVTGKPLRIYKEVGAELVTSWARAVDHIFPEKFCRRFCIGSDPHVLENLICVTPSLHAQKTAVEWRIFRGDMIGYRQELNRLGFDLELLDRAMKAICASVNK